MSGGISTYLSLAFLNVAPGAIACTPALCLPRPLRCIALEGGVQEIERFELRANARIITEYRDATDLETGERIPALTFAAQLHRYRTGERFSFIDVPLREGVTIEARAWLRHDAKPSLGRLTAHCVMDGAWS